MGARNLRSQIRREFRANPGKSAVLAVLALVVVYFWGPPLLRTVLDDAATASPGANVVAGQPVRGDSTAPARSASQATSRQQGVEDPSTTDLPADWRLVRKRLRNSADARPADLSEFRRNPFRADESGRSPPVLFAEEPPTSAGARDDQSVEATPQEAGLVLSSTLLIGPGRRLAMINGRVYQEGTTVESASGEFVLLEVLPRRVILKRGERRYDLALPGGNASGRVWLETDGAAR